MLRASKGSVYKVVRRGRSGALEEVELTRIGETVAKRVVYQGDVVWYDDAALAIFKDPVTGIVYATLF